MLSDAYFRLADYKSAIFYKNREISLFGNDQSRLFTLAIYYLESGNKELAEKAAIEAMNYPGEDQTI